MGVRSYRDLQVWQKGVDFAVHCYHATKSFPQSEAFGLTSQIRRAAVSVPANVAEGHARTQRKEFVRFVAIAQGSLAELETHLTVAARLGFLPESQASASQVQAAEIGRMLTGLRLALRKPKKTE